MKRVIYLISIFLLLFTLQVRCQNNLVPNPSFEYRTSCPPPGNLNLCYPWVNPTNTTNSVYLTVHFSSCTTNGCCGVPSNIFGSGYQYARTGNGYASGFITAYYGSTVRNYSQSVLLNGLKNGQYYYVELYVNLVNRSAYGCNNIGLYISKTPPTFNPGQIITANPQIINYSNPIITDTLNWIKVSGVYKAQGGEKYITIGNFKSDAQTDTLLINSSASSNYGQYNIDDVSVIPLDSFNLKADAGRDTTITIGDSAFIGTYTNGIDTLKWQILATNNIIDTTRPGFWVKPLVNTCYILTQTVNGFTSSDTVCVNVQPLPLNFLNYELRVINEHTPNPSREGKIKNIWTTANEINVSHFNIQRSSNSKDYITIDKVKAQNKNYNEYSFTDELNGSSPSPLGEGWGEVYYRIQSIDFDEKKQYSEVRNIEYRTRNNELRIYPNPAKEFITVECKGAKELLIIDNLGRIILQLNNLTEHQTINTKQFTKGLYVIKIITLKGEIKTEKLIID